MKKDEFSIYERLINNINREVQSDQAGIQRNLSTIKELERTNTWLSRRIVENVKAQKLLLEAQSK